MDNDLKPQPSNEGRDQVGNVKRPPTLNTKVEIAYHVGSLRFGGCSFWVELARDVRQFPCALCSTNFAGTDFDKREFDNTRCHTVFHVQSVNSECKGLLLCQRLAIGFETTDSTPCEVVDGCAVSLDRNFHTILCFE